MPTNPITSAHRAESHCPRVIIRPTIPITKTGPKKARARSGLIAVCPERFVQQYTMQANRMTMAASERSQNAIFIFATTVLLDGGVCLLPCYSGVPGNSDEKVTVGYSFSAPDQSNFWQVDDGNPSPSFQRGGDPALTGDTPRSRRGSALAPRLSQLRETQDKVMPPNAGSRPGGKQRPAQFINKLLAPFRGATSITEAEPSVSGFWPCRIRSPPRQPTPAGVLRATSIIGNVQSSCPINGALTAIRESGRLAANTLYINIFQSL